MSNPADSDLTAWLEQFARAGTWSVNLPDGTLTVSEQLTRMLAWSPETPSPPGTPGTCDAALAVYAQPFRPRMAEVLQLCADDGTPFDEEVQLMSADGDLCWARAYGRALRDAAGTVTVVQGLLQDLTE